MLARYQVYVRAAAAFVPAYGILVELIRCISLGHYFHPQLVRKANDLLSWLRDGLLLGAAFVRAVGLCHACRTVLDNHNVAAKRRLHLAGLVHRKGKASLAAIRVVHHGKELAGI